MEPLIALVATTLVVNLIGRLRVPSWRPWPVALRTGVAVMFAMTGISHFVGMRDEMVAMVPPALPAPEFWVAITGLLELAAAGALLFWPRMRRWAAAGLALLLLALFPANVYKALTEDQLRWDDALVPRTILQALFLAAVVAVLIYENRQARVRALDSEIVAAV